MAPIGNTKLFALTLPWILHGLKWERRALVMAKRAAGAFLPPLGLVAPGGLPSDSENFLCWKSCLCRPQNSNHRGRVSKWKRSFLSVWLGNRVSHQESMCQRGTHHCLSLPLCSQTVPPDLLESLHQPGLPGSPGHQVQKGHTALFVTEKTIFTS